MILVTGAGGNVGRHITRGLVDAGHDVRALTRDPARTTFPADVEVMTGDLSDPATLTDPLSGVRQMFLFPAFGATDGVVTAARRAGVEHVVMLSSSAIEHSDPGWIGDQHRRCEDAVVGSGLDWTFVRPEVFMANDIAWAEQLRRGRTIRAPYGNSSTAPIDERDIAAVATIALLERHSQAVHSLTGPEALTTRARVRIIGDTLGLPIEFAELGRSEARRDLVEQMPAEAADFLLDALAAAEHRTASTSSRTEQVTGQPAHTYAQWAHHRRTDFVVQPAAHIAR